MGYPRKYDASVFRAAGSYRNVHEMADADADAPTDSSQQKKVVFFLERFNTFSPSGDF